jgi:hypothetical protein
MNEKEIRRIICKYTKHVAPVDIDIDDLDYEPVDYDYDEELTSEHGRGRLLSTPRFVPMDVNKLTGDGVVRDGEVQLEEGSLKFSDDPYPDGTKVEVKIKNDYYRALSEDELKRKEEEQENWSRLKEAVKQYDTEKRVEDRQEFWDSYDIPIDYKLAVNLRKSQLRRGSTGTGLCQDSVHHLYVCESFKDGRLERDEGRFLCKGESDNPSVVQHSLNYYPSEGEKYARKVSCKSCQNLMERWLNEE